MRFPLPSRAQAKIAGGAFFLGIMVAVPVTLFFHDPVPAQSALGHPLRAEGNYTYVKPLLACDVGVTLESPELDALQAELDHAVEQATFEKRITDASVFVRELDSGIWTSVHADKQYEPASLFKVPILMAYLKQSRSQPDLLEQKITVTADHAPEVVQTIAPEKSVVVGETYTVKELLEYMILFSDNRALNALADGVDQEILHELFSELGVPIPAKGDDDYALSARLYSRFFRILYNATYLGPQTSEYALDLLAQVTYKEGLAANTPDNIAVAHKFGAASIPQEDGSKVFELHDCGIVYDNTPYAVCIMTRGNDQEALPGVIAELAAIVHQQYR